MEVLFAIKYGQEFGEGKVLEPAKRRLLIEYRPASASFGKTVKLPLDLPDIEAYSAPVCKFRGLFDECMNDLDAYSRYLGKRPDNRGDLDSVALMPRELVVQARSKSIGKLNDWIAAKGPLDTMPLVPAEELFQWVQTKQPDKMYKGEAVQLAQILEKFGVGIEPDVRFVGTPYTKTGKSVLFRLEQTRNSPTDEYRTAALFIHFSAMVAAADGAVSDEEEKHLEQELEKSVPLDDDERGRLRAHMRWLLADPPSFAGLQSRLAHLPMKGRNRVAGFCATLACADGRVDPGEIKVLGKIYKALGLDEKLVYSHVHGMAAGGAGDTGPVLVRTGPKDSGGYAINKPTESVSYGKDFTLDEKRIEQLMQVTGEVEKLLGDIFADENGMEPVATVDRPAGPAASLLGLDEKHSALLRALIARESWTREKFEALAAEHGLTFPDAALETINQAAYDRYGEPVIEEDGDIYVNTQQLNEESEHVPA